MTGRELIVYILENHLEDEPVFKDGTFVGYISDKEVAIKMNVGINTVKAWADLGIIDAVHIGDRLYIPAVNFFVTGGNKNER